MPANNILDILMFAAVCALLMAGYPVAFTLAGTGLAFAGLGAMFGVFDLSFFGALPSRIYGYAMTNEVLVAVPLFVFMGVMLERSKVAEDLLDSMGMLFGGLRGGLGISVSVVGALMAASTGIVGATVVTMGLLSLPTMLRRGYAPWLACGSICAAGTLGQIIPPSIVLVLLADQISNAHVDAQRLLGNFAPEPVSVGDLFAGAILPGFALVGMYVVYQAIIAWIRPATSPAIPQHEIAARRLARRIVPALIPPVALIVAVLGSILAGVATPTEAASVGAVGAILLAALRVRPEPDEAPSIVALIAPRGPWPIYAAVVAMAIMLALANTLDLRLMHTGADVADRIGVGTALVAVAVLVWGLAVSLGRVRRARVAGTPVLGQVMRATMEISAMVFVILIGASVFSLVFRGLGGDTMVHGALSALPGGALGAMTVVMAVMFLLGFFLDFIEITFVVVPIVAPVLLSMGLDPVWLGVMMAVNLQTSFLTPPFGFSLFYLRGVAPAEVGTLDIYRGVTPFVIIQLIALVLLAIYPTMATWLPKLVFG